MVNFKTILQQTQTEIGTVGAWLIDTVLPHRCLACRTILNRGMNRGLCPECWQKICFLDEGGCVCCGRPFTVIENNRLCLSCIADTPPFDRARAVFIYDEASRDLILALKHADTLHGTPVFGRWLARIGYRMLADADFVAPVPLHRWRLFLRRYNQAALLALSLIKASPKTAAHYVPQLLHRQRATPSLGHFNSDTRHAYLRGAIAINPKLSVRDKKILLIDDVITSGATVGECARVLKKAGALRVDVLTLARVIYRQ
ncbi:MAG: ComF family protein [Alphaproteobacteria bacterium]